jgi:hypothetical protein
MCKTMQRWRLRGAHVTDEAPRRGAAYCAEINCAIATGTNRTNAFRIVGVTPVDELRTGQVTMWMLHSSFHTDDETAAAFSVQRGRRRQAVLGRTDLVGDEPRLLIDFNKGAPLFSVGGQQVGERRKDIVSLWGEQYRLRRRGFRPLGLRFEATWGDRVVLRVRQKSRSNATVRVFSTHSAADLDPIVTLGLILVEARPDRMGILGELTSG